MNEPLRQSLLQACAFATVFAAAADREIRGAPSDARKDAAKQLQAALRIIEEE